MLHLSIRPDFQKRSIMGVAIYTYPVPLQLPLPIVPIFCRASTIKQILLNGSECPLDALFPVNQSLLYSSQKSRDPPKQFTSLLDLQDLIYTSRAVRYRVGDFFLDLSSILPQFALTKQIRASNTTMSKLLGTDSSSNSASSSSAVPHFSLTTITLIFETHNKALFVSYPSISNLISGKLSTMLVIGSTANAADWLPVPLFSMSLKHNITVQFSNLSEMYRPICGGRLSVCAARDGSNNLDKNEAVGYLFTEIVGNLHNLGFMVARADAFLYLQPLYSPDSRDSQFTGSGSVSFQSFNSLRAEYYKAIDQTKTADIYRLALSTTVIHRIFSFQHSTEGEGPGLNLICYTLTNMRQYDLSAHMYTLYKVLKLAIEFVSLTPFGGPNFNLAIVFDGSGRTMVRNNLIVLPLMPCNYTEARISYLKLISDIVAQYIFGVHIPAADYASQPTCLVLQQALMLHLRYALLGAVDTRRLYYEASIRGASGISPTTPTLWHQYLPYDIEERYNPGQSYLHHIKSSLNHGLYGTPMDKIDTIWKDAGRTSKGALNNNLKKCSIKAPACISRMEATYNFLDTSFGTSFSVLPYSTQQHDLEHEGSRENMHKMKDQISPATVSIKAKKGKKQTTHQADAADLPDAPLCTAYLKETDPAEVAALTADRSRWFNKSVLYHLDFLSNLYQPVLASDFAQLETINTHVEGITQKTTNQSGQGLTQTHDNELDELIISQTADPPVVQSRSADQLFSADDAGTDIGLEIDSQSAASTSVFGMGKQSGTLYSIESQVADSFSAMQRASNIHDSQYSTNISNLYLDEKFSGTRHFSSAASNSRVHKTNDLQLDVESLSLMYFYINEPFFPVAYAVPEANMRVRAEIVGMTIRNNLTSQGLQTFFKKFISIEYVHLNTFFKFLDEVCFNKHYFTGGTWLKTITPDLLQYSPDKDAGIEFPDSSLSILPDTGEFNLNTTILKGAAGAGVGFSVGQYRLNDEALRTDGATNDSFHGDILDIKTEDLEDGAYRAKSFSTFNHHSNTGDASKEDVSSPYTTHPFTLLIHKLGITTSLLTIAYSCHQDALNNQVTDQFGIMLMSVYSGLIETLKETQTKMGLPLINRGEIASGCRRLLLLPESEGRLGYNKNYEFTALANALELGDDCVINGLNSFHYGDKHDSGSFTILKGASTNLYASIHMLQQPGKMGSNGSGTLSFNLLTGVSNDLFEGIKARLTAGHSFYDYIKMEKFSHIIIDPYNQMPFAYKHHYTEENDKDNNCYRAIAKIDCERDIAVQLESLNSLCYNCNNNTIPLLLGILYSEAVAPVLQETAFKVLIYKVSRDNFYEIINKEMGRLEEASKDKEHKRWILLLNSYFFGHRRLLKVLPTPTEGYEGININRYDFECIKKLGVSSLISYALLCGYISTSKAVDLFELLNMDHDIISSRHALTIAVLQAFTWQIIRKVIILDSELHAILLLLIKLVLSNATLMAIRRMAICSLTLIVSTAWESPKLATILIGLLYEKNLISEKTMYLIRHTFGAASIIQGINNSSSVLNSKDSTEYVERIKKNCCNCCNCNAIGNNDDLATFVASRVIFAHLLLDFIEAYIEANRVAPDAFIALGQRRLPKAVITTFINREFIDECFYCLALMGKNNCMTSSDSTQYIVQPLSHQFVSALYRGTTYAQTHSIDTANAYAMSNAEALVFMMTYVTHLFTLPLNESKQVEWGELRGCPICLVSGSCQCVRVSWPAIKNADSKSTLKSYVTVRCLMSDFFQTYEKHANEYSGFEEYFDRTYRDQDPITSTIFENSKLVGTYFYPRKRYEMMLFRRTDRGDKESNSINPEPQPNSCYPEFMLPCLYNVDTGINYPNYIFRQCLFDAAGCIIGQSIGTRLLDLLLYPAGKNAKKDQSNISYDYALFKGAASFGDDISFRILDVISSLHGLNLIRNFSTSQFDKEASITTLAEFQTTREFKNDLLNKVHEHGEYVNIMATFCEENLTQKAGSENVSKTEHNMGYLIHALYEPAKAHFRGTMLRFAGFIIGYLPD